MQLSDSRSASSLTRNSEMTPTKLEAPLLICEPSVTFKKISVDKKESLSLYP